jgi:hypothetical protein
MQVSCVLVVAHCTLSKCDRSRKYNNPNNKIIVMKIITILCQRISLCVFHKVWCMCNKESTSIECRGVAR